MLRIFRIQGHSLAPEYQPGDFVLVSKIPFYFRPPRPGEVVAFRHPAFGLLIKQVERSDPHNAMLTVLGTHPDSVDSREFGPIACRALLGKILWHIHPAR